MKSFKLPVILLSLIVCQPLSADVKSHNKLTLADVQQAAEQAFPLLLAAEQRRISVEGDLLSAEGGFDTQLKGQARWSIAGLFENENYDVNIEQPTSFFGTTFFGGWRRGTGTYPIYEGKSQTANDGELRIGVNVPLWRNRDIDRRRAALKQAELAKLIAGHDVEQALLQVRQQAAYRYWDWVLAGQRLKLTEKLLATAEARNQAILDRVALGEIPQFEAVENQRAIIERQERKVAAQRLLEQSAIQLSLFWRDAEGQPMLPDSTQLPDGFPEQEPALALDIEQALSTAQAQRPELNKLGLQQKQTETDLELHNNQQAPGIDFSVQGAFDSGTFVPAQTGSSSINRSINRDEVYLGLNIDIPLQQRVAKGRAKSAAANLRRLQLEKQQAENQIAAEIKDVFSKLAAARKRLELSKAQLQTAQLLQEGEQQRFDLGESNILIVNLREITSGDAGIAVIEAANSLFKAHADFQVALGAVEKNPSHQSGIKQSIGSNFN
ncbi:MAG: type I secretion protein TolC [Methylomonas sp.]|nr:MAG: type I secretion protein TolC [Methylobacter sp.]PPD35999.1 MAG: type I secretion protein TolC [Methylomonas sp.]